MAKNDITGKKDWKEVSQTFINHNKEVYVVTFEIGGVEVESLGTTSEHPFWVEGVGWPPASDLKAGDQVVTATGIDLVVKRVIATGTFKTTYNFEVKDYHTYFVGEAGVWVHNVCATAFEESISHLPPGERVAKVTEKVRDVAAARGWSKDNRLTKLNNRDVYRGDDGYLYAVDTQHGLFERVNAKNGKHLGEFDFDLSPKGKVDNSGGHDLKVK